MGCGNSSPTSSANSHGSSSKAAHPEGSSKVSEDDAADDDKRKNYGGVYVGLPTDLSNIPTVQIGSLRGVNPCARERIHVEISIMFHFLWSLQVRRAWENNTSNCYVCRVNEIVVHRERARFSIPEEATVGKWTIILMNQI